MTKQEIEIKLSYARADVKKYENFFKKIVFIVMIKEKIIKNNL